MVSPAPSDGPEAAALGGAFAQGSAEGFRQLAATRPADVAAARALARLEPPPLGLDDAPVGATGKAFDRYACHSTR
jgi:hypothetical protein